jgi:hypothetical protein
MTIYGLAMPMGREGIEMKWPVLPDFLKRRVRSPGLLMGKHVIAGITFKDGEGREVDHFQTHGRIVEVGNTRGIVLEKADGSGRFHLPPNVDWLKPARPGSYRLRNTGEVVIDPDYLSTTILDSVVPENIERYKAQGFLGTYGPQGE